MIARAGSGWQTLLADLSIILFMVTAAALSQTKGAATVVATPQPSPRSEPLSVWRSGAGAPPLSQWLTLQAPDDRQQLTVVAHYPPGGQQAALRQAQDLLAAAGSAGGSARLLVEPGPGGIVASLAYDVPDTPASAGMARGLQSLAVNTTAKDTTP